MTVEPGPTSRRPARVRAAAITGAVVFGLVALGLLVTSWFDLLDLTALNGTLGPILLVVGAIVVLACLTCLSVALRTRADPGR